MENKTAAGHLPPENSPIVVGSANSTYNTEYKISDEAILKSFPFPISPIMIVLAPLAAIITILEIPLKFFAKLNPRNWPIFKHKSIDRMFP